MGDQVPFHLWTNWEKITFFRHFPAVSFFKAGSMMVWPWEGKKCDLTELLRFTLVTCSTPMLSLSFSPVRRRLSCRTRLKRLKAKSGSSSPSFWRMAGNFILIIVINHKDQPPNWWSGGRWELVPVDGGGGAHGGQLRYSYQQSSLTTRCSSTRRRRGRAWRRCSTWRWSTTRPTCLASGKSQSQSWKMNLKFLQDLSGLLTPPWPRITPCGLYQLLRFSGKGIIRKSTLDILPII